MADHAQHVSCSDVVELVTEYLEQALPPDEATLFEEHLNFCEGCAVYVEQIRATVGTVGRLREEDVPPETKERLMAAFRDWKRS
jgi:anti-sigma factor RsiW